VTGLHQEKIFNQPGGNSKNSSRILEANSGRIPHSVEFLNEKEGKKDTK